MHILGLKQATKAEDGPFKLVTMVFSVKSTANVDALEKSPVIVLDALFDYRRVSRRKRLRQAAKL